MTSIFCFHYFSNQCLNQKLYGYLYSIVIQLFHAHNIFLPIYSLCIVQTIMQLLLYTQGTPAIVQNLLPLIRLSLNRLLKNLFPPNRSQSYASGSLNTDPGTCDSSISQPTAQPHAQAPALHHIRPHRYSMFQMQRCTSIFLCPLQTIRRSNLLDVRYAIRAVRNNCSSYSYFYKKGIKLMCLVNWDTHVSADFTLKG